jgi:thioredoxin 1
MKIINSEEFKNIRNDGKVVVDFYADWCGPCKMLSPILEEVSEDHQDIKFVKINVDENEELAAEFGIMSIPAVFMLKDGNIVNKFLGAQSKRVVEEQVEKAFN